MTTSDKLWLIFGGFGALVFILMAVKQLFRKTPSEGEFQDSSIPVTFDGHGDGGGHG